MKKIISLLMLVAMTMPLWAEEHTVTISRSEGEFSESSGVYYGIKDGVMMTFTSGLDNENYLVEHQQTNFEVRSSHYIIKKIVFHCLDDTESDNLDCFYWGPTTISINKNFTYPNSPGMYDAEGFVGTWEGETKAIQFSTMAKPVRFASIDITYEKLEGDIFDLVTSTDQIQEGKTYIIVSRYYNKVMKFKKSDDATFMATDIVEWMNDAKTKVKVDGNACLFTMEGVNLDTLRTNNKYERAAWFNTLNGYIRSQNYNLTMLTTPSAYCRAHMYISANESNLLLKFNDMSSGNNYYTVRYDYEGGQFKMLNYNDDSQQRVWLYKLAETYNVTTECKPKEGGVIDMVSGVVDGTSQQYETVVFSVTENLNYAFNSLQITCADPAIVIEPARVSTVTNENGTRTITYSFAMPASDVHIVANFDADTSVGIDEVSPTTTVQAVEYYNIAVNIVVTRYSDGSTSTARVIK